MILKNLTASLITTNVEEYNEAYLKYRETSKDMAQSCWWKGGELIKNITTELVQISDFGDLRSIEYPDQTRYTFKVGENYYTTKLIDTYNKNLKCIFKSGGEFEAEIPLGNNYVSKTNSYVFVIDENYIEEEFIDYHLFLERETKLKKEAWEQNNKRAHHISHIDLVIDLHRGNYSKLGRLDITVDDIEVTISFKGVAVFKGYYSDNYWCVEYNWLKQGKYQTDIFKLLDEEKSKIVKNRESYNKKKLARELKILSEY